MANDSYWYKLQLAELYENGFGNKKIALKYYQKYNELLPKIVVYEKQHAYLEQKIQKLKEDIHFEGQ